MKKTKKMILGLGLLSMTTFSLIGGQQSVNAEKLTIKLTNSENKPVIGSSWQLYKNGELLETYPESTNEMFIFETNELTDGDYSLKEVKNANGYLLNNEKIEFKIPYVADGKKYEDIKITPKFNLEKNEPVTTVGGSVEKKTFVKTGLSKSNSFILGTISLIGLSLLSFFGYKKFKNNKEQ